MRPSVGPLPLLIPDFLSPVWEFLGGCISCTPLAAFSEGGGAIIRHKSNTLGLRILFRAIYHHFSNVSFPRGADSKTRETVFFLFSFMS